MQFSFSPIQYRLQFNWGMGEGKIHNWKTGDMSNAVRNLVAMQEV
jgi:hypothetical protein